MHSILVLSIRSIQTARPNAIPPRTSKRITFLHAAMSLPSPILTTPPSRAANAIVALGKKGAKHCDIAAVIAGSNGLTGKAGAEVEGHDEGADVVVSEAGVVKEEEAHHAQGNEAGIRGFLVLFCLHSSCICLPFSFCIIGIVFYLFCFVVFLVWCDFVSL